MICLACRGLTRGDLCGVCRGRLRPAPERPLDGGVLVRSGHLHDGPARQLVHRLKYDGIVVAAERLAAAMLPLIVGRSVLVPVPRTTVRTHRYGIDPGLELALALSRMASIPVRRALVPAIRGPVHAGRTRSERPPPRFQARGSPDVNGVLIDDVVTTGTSLVAAARATGLKHAVTATSRVLDGAHTSAGPVSRLKF